MFLSLLFLAVLVVGCDVVELMALHVGDLAKFVVFANVDDLAILDFEFVVVCDAEVCVHLSCPCRNCCLCCPICKLQNCC